jgi:hypothetical protein
MANQQPAPSGATPPGQSGTIKPLRTVLLSTFMAWIFGLVAVACIAGVLAHLSGSSSAHNADSASISRLIQNNAQLQQQLGNKSAETPVPAPADPPVYVTVCSSGNPANNGPIGSLPSDTNQPVYVGTNNPTFENLQVPWKMWDKNHGFATGDVLRLVIGSDGQVQSLSKVAGVHNYSGCEQQNIGGFFGGK